MVENNFCHFLHVICVDINSCLLSAFGAVLAAATLYDVLTFRRKTHYNAGIQSTMTVDGAEEPDSLINNHQLVVFSQTDDLPLILDTPEDDSNCQHACGISSFFFLPDSVNLLTHFSGVAGFSCFSNFCSDKYICRRFIGVHLCKNIQFQRYDTVVVTSPRYY